MTFLSRPAPVGSVVLSDNYNLASMLSCYEYGSADQEGVEFARVGLPKVLANLQIGSTFNV